MSKKWQSKPLSEICELVNGRAYKKDELLDFGKYPVLRVGNFFTNDHWYHSDLELSEDKYCDKGDLLYAWSASFGPRIWEGEKVIYHYHIWKVLPNEELVDKRFLFYLLEWDVDQIKQLHGTGATMIHVSKGSMESRVVPVPSLDEQGKIVSIIGRAFEEISNAIANVKKNLENISQLLESELDKIYVLDGKKLERIPLSEVLVKTSNVNPTAKPSEEFTYIDVSSVSNKTYQVEATQKLLGMNAPSRARKLVKRNDIIFATVRPTLKRVAVIPDELDGQVCSTGYFVLRPKDGLHYKYLFYYLLSRHFQQQMEKMQKGASYPAVTDGNVSSQLIPLPSIEEQIRISNRLDELSVEIKKLGENYQRKLEALDELKKSILQQAFTGQLC